MSSDARLSQVRTWVFDLDHTLYPPEAALFALIEARMTGYLMRELGLPRGQADRLRADYWRLYGTTLSGLMAEHQIDPMPFLDEVHDIPLTSLTPDPALASGIAALPGRRVVFTNASVPYAQRVLQARGLSGLFDQVYGIESAGFHPKPAATAYARVFAQEGLAPATSAMFEDDPRNLAEPHRLGLVTVLVAPEPVTDAPHIHHQTPDLTGFLRGIVGRAP